MLRAISGEDGAELWTITNELYRVIGASGVAVGDLDGDGAPEIVATHESGVLIAFSNTGALKWKSICCGTGWGGVALADLDHDGKSEVIAGATVLNYDGTIRWHGSSSGGTGKGDNGFGPLSLVADIDLDGSPEVVAGQSAYRANGALYWNAPIPDGFPGVANFAHDPFPEIVVVARGSVYMLENDGVVRWGPVPIPGGGLGGAPTIADMDGDGVPEIGVVSETAYTVFRGDGTVLWSHAGISEQTGLTGSTACDLDGDGLAEVLYADHFFFRIFRGATGEILHQSPKSSGTTYELPIVADVNGDGSAEIVMVGNNYAWGSQHGIYVLGDAKDSWVNSRKIWNQHTYHINNINDDGTIPRFETNSWTTHNTYRLNLQTLPGGALAAPDLVPSFVRAIESDSIVTVTARIGNGGLVLVLPGLSVAFYNGDPRTNGTLLGTNLTTTRLDPGGFVDVSLSISNLAATDLWVVADDNGVGRGQVSECNELNNFYRTGLSLPLLNHAPVITSAPDTAAGEALPYEYAVQAADSDDGDVLNFTLGAAPVGMTIVPTTGSITWTPGADDNGTHFVQVTVTDNRGGRGFQTFAVTVTNRLNASPAFVSVPIPNAPATQNYFYFALAQDAEGDALTYDLIIHPEGMLVETNTGVIALSIKRWMKATDASNGVASKCAR